MKNHKCRNIIGPQVRKLRYAKGWSQEKFADELQMHGLNVRRCGVIRIESQEMWVGDFEMLIIAEVLGVDVQELFPRFSRREPLYSSIKRILSGQVKTLMSPDAILAAETERLTASLKEIP